MPQDVYFGIDQKQRLKESCKEWGNYALVCNQASLDAQLQATPDVLRNIQGKQAKLTCIWGPQHGFFGHAQDNMIETEDDTTSPVHQVPIYSLYGKTREPTPPMLSKLNSIIVDIQLSGTRVYTYKATLLATLKAAKRANLKVVILDRPNPLGGKFVAGRVLEQEMISFVGPDLLPMRHGLSTGEMARFLNRKINADLEVIEIKGWNPDTTWLTQKRPWILTSPNLPTLKSVILYPGLVALEGCNLSEGRGTTLPFECVGSRAFVNPKQLIGRLYDLLPKLQGVQLRPFRFEPTFSKWSGHCCYGVQFIVENPDLFCSFHLGIALIKCYMDLIGDNFAFKAAPYEYEYRRNPMDLILGSREGSKKIEDYRPDDSFWSAGLTDYCAQVAPYLIYPRAMTPTNPQN